MSHPKRRAEDHENWFVRAGNLTRSVKFVLSVLAVLLMASILFQYTAQRADVQAAQDELQAIETLLLESGAQRQKIKEQTALILDCTQAGGDCFEKAQEKTAEVVAGLNVVTQYSVICGERVNGEAEILECVNDEVQAYLRATRQQDRNN